MEYIEVSAKTVDDAILEAAIKFGTTRDKIAYEVISQGSTGFLGIGSKKAVIKAHVRTEEEVQTSRKAEKEVEKILEKVNDLFDDKYETYYIPAGRQLLTLLASQKTKLDYDSIDLVNRKFMQFNESIQSRFEHGISNAHKFYPIPNRKFDTGRISSEIRGGLKGDYRVTSAGERLRLDNGNDIPVNYASSGQQEILWLYNQLYILMLREEKAFVIIEEPEAHLYPALQKAVIEFIAQFSNLNQSTVLVTTHSPYVLTAANVLHYAGRLGKKYGNQVGRVVGKDKWIAPDEFTAFKLEQDEQGHTSAELLVDDETEELRTSLIDEISNEIGETYTKLYYLEVDNEDT